MIQRVVISVAAQKQLRKVPSYVVDKLLAWTVAVKRQGLEEMRKIPGFHDELLRGRRKGQRSIRLSRSYRAIYCLRKDGGIEFVYVEEVTKHGY